MKQTAFEIVRAQAQDAAALLEYLKIIGGETDNLSFGPEGVPLGLEEEQAYLSMQAQSRDHMQLFAKVNGEIIGTASLNRKPNRMHHRAEFGISLKNCHFWGMDEWIVDGKAAGLDFPLGFAKADLDLCFNRIDPKLRMPAENMHFPTENPAEYSKTYDEFRCVTMQGGQGETKHWAFNDPVKREGKYIDNPPTPEEYLQKGARVVELHPITLIQNARTSGGGTVQNVPSAAVSVGPVETWKAEKVSIWHPGHHDNPFGQRLTTFMISKKIADSAVPMSLLSKHPGEIIFNFYRGGFGVCDVEMH